MRHWRFRATITILALLVSTAAFGQAQTTGAVTGVVVDENGARVPGAEVTLSSAAIQGERTTRTNASGAFTVRLLPPGQYTAVILSPGYQAAVVTFTVLIGSTQGLDVTLYPGADYAEEIVVHGRVSPLESTETRATFDYSSEVEELPIQNRDINLIALNAPNTSFGPNVGQVSISGAPSFDTVVLLDGAEISDPYFGAGTTVYLEDSIQEVQVLTTGISPRYGRFQGGVINAVTKSGGNEFSGILRAEFTNEDWNSQTPFGEQRADSLNETYQATLGGFILRDRLWFFGGYRTIPETTNNFTTLVTGETFTTTSTQDRFQIKLRGAITASHTIDGSYLEFDAVTSGRAGLPAGDLLATNGVRSDPRDMTSISYQGVFGFNTFVDAIVTEKNVAISSGGDPGAGDPIIDAWDFRVFNNHWWDSSDPDLRNNKTAAVNLSHLRDAGRFGSHMLEGGVQYVDSITAGDNRQSPTGYNFYAETPTFNPRTQGNEVLFDVVPGELILRWEALALGAESSIQSTALYLQDSITWNDFRFDVGARYDEYASSSTGIQGTIDLDFREISPRLGVTYNITPGWQVVGTWGKYVGRFNDSWSGDATGVGAAPNLISFYTGPERLGVTRRDIENILRDESVWTLVDIWGSPEFPTVYVDPNIRSPYSEEFNLSLRAALPGNSGFASVTYTNREFFNLVTGFTGLACTDFGHCSGGDFSALPGGVVTDTTVMANDPRATRDYNAISLQADYRPTARLTVGGNWTWSETRGNYEGEAANLPASGSPHGTFERARQMEAAVPYGYLNPHIRHRAVAYSTYRFGLNRFGNLSTSGIVNYRSGRVWSKIAAVPEASVAEYETPASTYAYFFDGRGNNEFPSVWSLDFAARWGLPLFNGRVAPFVKIDVANILNLDQLISYQTTGTRVAVRNPDNSFSHWKWAPAGNCGLDDAPSRSCTGFGRISSQANYQAPRTIELSIGLQF
jgi:hypothetical protein